MKVWGTGRQASLVLVVTCFLASGLAQNDSDLYAHWLPTDLNYALISSLTGTNLQGINQAIAGEASLPNVQH